MRKPLYIYGVGNYYHSIDETLPELKTTILETCGKKIRRIDRLTQLSLIGCWPCQKELALAENTGIYLSSIYGGINNSVAMLSEIYQKGLYPKPLTFINSVSNAACYYLSEQLNLQSYNQFVSRENFTLEAALKIASIDLELGNVAGALVGVVSEVGKNLAVHRSRFGINSDYSLAEGSHWLYVTNQLNDAPPLAQVIQNVEPISDDSLRRYLECEFARASTAINFAFSDNVEERCKAKLLEAFDVSELSYMPDNMRHEFPAGFQLCGFLESCQISTINELPKRRFIYLDRDKHKRWCLVVLESC